MSRRSRRPTNDEGRKSVFDRDQTRTIDAKINTLERDSIAIMCPRHFTGEDVIRSLFEDSDIEILRAAFGKVQHDDSRATYRGFTAGRRQRVTIHINFDAHKMVPPHVDRAINWNNAHLGLADCLDEAARIHATFEQVREVFNFLNANGTAGAMRYYWPAVMSLYKGANSPLNDVDGTRFRDIPGVAPYIGAMRDTSATIASALLLPPQETQDATMTFWFQTETSFSQTWNLI